MLNRRHAKVGPPATVTRVTDRGIGRPEEGAHLVADHGRRRVGHISGPLDHQTAIDRYAGESIQWT